MSDSSHITELAGSVNRAFLMPEQEALAHLRTYLKDYHSLEIAAYAASLVNVVRAKQSPQAPFAAFLQEYGLDSEEGIVLMGIAEALLRIPDIHSQNLFLQEKLADADWHSHLAHSDSMLVNLATGGLMLGARIEQRVRHSLQHRHGILDGLLQRLGQPLIRNAVKQAMRQMAHYFVMAESIEAAIELAGDHPFYRYSFDMLGEAALTEEDAQRYYQAYSHAIEALAASSRRQDLFASHGISLKLSALCPRYEVLQYCRAVPELQEKLLNLAKQARAAGISLTVDAEEAERLQMSLDIFAAVSGDPAMRGWPGLGIAVQAYQKRAIYVIEWLAALADAQKRRIPLRLVKGAYWDSEIKRAQENGWSDYPVFTEKSATDVSYLACARRILALPEAFYPQFATHNAHSVAAISIFGQGHPGFEFQRLHGMGAALYDELLAQGNQALSCRVYAPVGGYRDLLPYLVRRLLENGANTSFINQIENPAIGLGQLTCDPLSDPSPATNRPVRPPDLFGNRRRNSHGLNLNDLEVLQQLQQYLDSDLLRLRQACPLIAGLPAEGERQPVYSPYDSELLVGYAVSGSPEQVAQAVAVAAQAFADWRLTPVENRAACLLCAADLLEQQRLELMALIVREGGRTVRDALAEVREAVDLCRYYAATALEQFAQAQALPGPTGEENHLQYYGRGTFVCISPWNFPLAIFTGQIAAALVAGNSVIAKPSQQTSLAAMACVELLHQAGVPKEVLHFLPGDGAAIGGLLLGDERIAGVAFTGSAETARFINRQLSRRHGPIAALIAETGGQNVMIADSSAHEQQLVADAVQSAFNSAGQRCSALRVLFLPEQIADSVIARLIGAMQLLLVGAPTDIAVDVGPIIDRRALAALASHLQMLKANAKLLYQSPLADKLANGCFFAPTLAEIPALSLLQQEVFGPILHIVRYAATALEQVVAEVNDSGYGLTLGVHSRIQANISYIRQHARVGNVYINRNMIGAVVGVQPFGGMGLSGTGPKAGGPNYLKRFVTEQTVTDNIAAIGGNPWLLGERPR